MRVTTGIARGKNLIAPQGLHTRPVTDQIKQAIFSSWQFKIPECTFLDLFSGSGSMGIEAISRGANKVIFCDNDNEAIKVININLKNCGFNTNKYQVIKDDVFKLLDNLSKEEQKFDIIYLDPPYTVDEIFIPVIQAVDIANIINEDGIIALRSHVDKKMPDELNNIYKYKEKKYGISMVHYYKKK